MARVMKLINTSDTVDAASSLISATIEFATWLSLYCVK